MLLKNKYQLFALLSVLVLGLITGVIYFQFWNSLSPLEQETIGKLFKDYFAYIFILLVLFVFGLGIAFDQLLNTYILPLKRVNEELNIVLSANSSHRLSLEGAKDIETLGQLINQIADRIEISENEIKATIHKARRELEEERNRLAAVISGLPEGVIICNVNWQVILYNQEARALLSNASEDRKDADASANVLGLGRSILGVLNKNHIVHAFDEISNRLDKKKDQLGYHFAHTTDSGKILNIHVIPILATQKEIYGFVLVLHDITQKMDKAQQRDLFFESLITSIRSAMSGVRAAMETIIDFPHMKQEERDRLRRIILDESMVLSRLIDGPEVENLLRSKTEWPMEDFQCYELLKLIQKKARGSTGIEILIEEPSEDCWVRVDSFSIVHGVLYLILQVSSELKPDIIGCRMERSGNSVHFDLYWHGKPVMMDTFKAWERKKMIIGEESIPLTLKEMVQHFDTSIWPQETTDGMPCLRMPLPYLPSKETRRIVQPTISIENRSEFYDFSMFDTTAVPDEYDNLPLKELIYTVFDTETTGLNPKEDEIISLGAVRIVNGRLLKEEAFDQLVNPERSVPEESIRFHGIQPEMLTGQPTIEPTLARFHQFAEDTVLVGHNAAFDMKMIQVKKEKTGIAFSNPVLDTLLLSAVIQPAQTDHSIETIAKRLGIRVIGRHTALGDAMTTGELFLKLIPLLASKQVVTLKQAIEASKRTYYARLKY